MAKIDFFMIKLAKELHERYQTCQDFAATPCNILLATANAVESARKKSNEVYESQPEVIDIIMEIRKFDCGAWLKDCQTVSFTCSEGHEKRLELSRLLDRLYKAAGI